MSNSIFDPSLVAAKNIDALNKTCVSSSTLYNGNIITLGALSTTRQQGDVFTAGTPATATLLTALFAIVSNPILVETTQGTLVYRGLNDDPRNYQINIGELFNVIIPKKGDEFKISVDGVTGTYNASTAQYLVPANGTSVLTWAGSATLSSVAVAFLCTNASDFISVGNVPRVNAYRMLCVQG